MNKVNILLILCLLGLGNLSRAQVCDPTLPPTGLTQTVMPGNGVLLQWTPVVGSTGVQVKAMLPSGMPITSARISGFELGSFHLNEPFLETGTYYWRVQASCGSAPGTVMTPPSSPSSFGFTPGFCPDSVSDVDGNYYRTTLIGARCWMAENLRTEHFRNGDPVPTGLSNADWVAADYGAYASPSAAHKADYGLLYNWFAVDDDRSICPVGFRIPNTDVFHSMVSLAGGEAVAGGALKATGTLDLGTGLWKQPNLGATNSTGFSALPAGLRYETGGYGEENFKAFFWTQIDWNIYWGRHWQMSKVNARANPRHEMQQAGMSVRCVAD